MRQRGPEKSELLDRAIGLLIQRERRRQRLTLQILSERAGLHRNTIDRAEQGRGIGLLALCRVALALKVKLDQLVPVSETIVQTKNKGAFQVLKAAKVHFGSDRLFDEPD